MSRRRSGLDISGLLFLDKPTGLSSNAALQRARRLFKANKAGHTGTLDPLATGLLPICFGEATKFSSFLLDAEKSYQVVAQFGLVTDSNDSDGEVLARSDASALTSNQVETSMASLRGTQQQVPPIYSAIKVAGKPLYRYAREGKDIDIASRTVEIIEFHLDRFTPGAQATGEFTIRCSKGTYVRSLIRDLGEQLGLGATVIALRRISSGAFQQPHMVSLEALEAMDESQRDALLVPMEQLVEHLPRANLDGAARQFFMQGQAVIVDEAYRFAAEGDIVRVFCDEGTFLGVGTVTDGSRVQPKRLRADL